LKLAETFTETFQTLKQAYGEDCLSHTQCYKWYQRFKSGRTSTEDDPKTGWLSTSTDDDHVEKVCAVIRENRRLIVHEVSEEAGISKSLCHIILTEKLEMHRVVAKFVPCLLTDEQKVNCVMVSQELFNRLNADENFLKNVIIGGETWVYGYDIKTKAQSSPQPKKAHQSRSNVKMLIFFYGKGVIHHEFVPRGQTVNGQFYLEV
jgi:hypothetical protein